MKRILFIAGIGLIFGMIGLAILQPKSEAAGCVTSQAQACGYFTGGYVSATDNVLPNPALSGVNAVGLTNAQRVQTFIGAVHYWMYSSTYRARVGAAFIIDSMLSYRQPVGQPLTGPVGGGQTAGISYVTANNNANYNRWVALVNYYGSSTSSSYGIQWGYKPLKSSFCSGRLDSGYDPGVNDVALYHTPGYGTGNCDYEWTHSMPEIRFFWPGGTFEIGTLCGNVQDNAGVIPSQDQMPTGTIIVTCKDPNTGLQNAHITFSDPDAATSAEFTVAGKLYGPYNPPSPQDQYIDLLLPPTTDAYNKQQVIISVKDTGPLGDGAYHAMPAVQTAAPCVKYGCSLSPPDPTPLDPNMGYSLTPGVTVSIGQSPSSPTISIVSIVKPGGGSYYSHGQIGAVNNGGTLQATFAGIPPTSSGGGGVGIYTVTWNLYTNGTLLTQCSGTFPVVYLPYANVYGGDVMVGASPSYSSGTSTCSAPNTKAGAYSWNNHKAAGFPGAGAQYAVQTLSDITDFASALGSTNAPPHSLSFANNAVGVNDGQGLFGGNFGAITADCGFTSDLNEPGVTHINGNTTLNIGTLLAGSRKIYEVTNGNVYISSDIKYDTAGWTDPTQIPYFKLVVVGGNIYVGSGVKQLDGIYVAESTNASNGVIYTCAKGNGSAWTPSAADLTAGYYTTCNQTLTVNGAFVAAQVQFERTHGTVGKAQASDNISTNPSPDAEVFNYTPEVWLPRNAGAPNGGYDTITGLPPVL